MIPTLAVISASLIPTTILAASIPEVSSRRGAELVAEYQCVFCHSVDGKGGKAAPDLGARLDRSYTAAGMASRMWNHAPEMWSAMKESKIALPQVSAGDAANLFAYFYAVRYFEKPGDAGRGKQVFEKKRCGDCHALPGAKASGSAKPVGDWRSVSDPVALVAAMWNHSGAMKGEASARSVKWPTLSAQELTDLLVWLQNQPSSRPRMLEFSLPQGTKGEQLLVSKGCAECHKGAMALPQRMAGKTLTEVAAAMWNHAPKMAAKVSLLDVGDTREILAYGWARSFFAPAGDSKKGAQTFQARCGSCHGTGGKAPAAPKLSAEGAVTGMVAALWKHGPAMLAEAQKQSKPWPALSVAEMANITAFLSGGKP